MIIDRFNDAGVPYVECSVSIPRLGVTSKRTEFLLDTGARSTCLHPADGRRLGIPFGQLTNEVQATGIGGESLYYREPAILVFNDGQRRQFYLLRNFLSPGAALVRDDL